MSLEERIKQIEEQNMKLAKQGELATKALDNISHILLAIKNRFVLLHKEVYTATSIIGRILCDQGMSDDKIKEIVEEFNKRFDKEFEISEIEKIFNLDLGN